LNLGAQFQIDAQFPGPCLQDLDQLEPPDAGEAMTVRGQLAALDEDIDIVPVMEIAFDLGEQFGVILSRKPAMVLSEKTIPQPKVLSAGLRSITVMLHSGLVFFIRIAK
jgi:hypothetical protein